MNRKLNITVLLYNNFELLDVFGPLEIFGLLQDKFIINLVSQSGWPTKSFQGPASVVNYSFSDEIQTDVLFIPGGQGARKEIQNSILIDWIARYSLKTRYIFSVCTGSALLAKAGVLDGRKATTNKIAFDWVSQSSNLVQWEKKSRWVVDSHVWTSSGVTAGIDMSFAFTEMLYGYNLAIEIANKIEYLWNNDSLNDPFYLEEDM
jgi:transcriptional regulator GlxA family with amidase domain